MVSTKNRWTPCREQEGSGRCVGQTLTNIADIQFEIIKARFALMVLVKRLCGWRPEDIDEVLAERLMEKLLQARELSE
ncbi:hypothetical protein ACNQJ9_25065, partial [Pseudomonas aeruginosa]|uniref:hypothetical protein n=1 Tax=Pseudomonas aeruginosa TaxID=287 RepID=UPI003AFB5772